MNVYVRELAAGLAGRGIDVDVLTEGPRDRLRASSSRVRVIELGRGGGESALPRYDVVHSHYWRSSARARRLLERPGAGARHVHTFHTLGGAKNAALAPGDTPEPADRLAAERAIVAGADAVVVATLDERAQLLAELGADATRVHVVAPGVDGRRFTPPASAAEREALRTALGLPDGVALAVHVGRIQPLKGIELAVRAVGRAAPDLGRRVVLALVGGPSGPTGPAALRELRREAARLPAGASLALLGRIGHGALPRLLGAADVALVTSRAESFGLAGLEAHACGVPVVATRVGGLPDVVADGDSGFVVARRSERLFATRLGDVLGADAAARRRMHAAAVESARRFSWEATAAGVAAAYGL